MPVLEEAARRFGAQISLVFHAFELRPDPVLLLDPAGEYLKEHWTRRVYPLAAERGLVMRQPTTQTRTRRAHETAAFARASGASVDRALFRAYFEHDRDINDDAVLEEIVESAGLDPPALRQALSTRTYAPVVEDDYALAARFGIRSVPTMLVADAEGRAEPVVGAVPLDYLEAAIARAIGRTQQGPA